MEPVGEQFPVLSLDVFDTAIIRRLAEPQHVFCEVESSLVASGFGRGARGFAEARRQAETTARREARLRGLDECSFDSIYDELAKSRPTWAPLLQAAKRIEVEVEDEVCEGNPEILDFYRSALEAGKRIIFTSDMYLPAEAIERLLRRGGFSQFAKVYVSSAYGQTKASGRLYKTLLGEEVVRPSQVFHTGDHPISDELNPRKLGIASRLYVRPRRSEAKGARVLDVSIIGVSRAKAAEACEASPRGDVWRRLGVQYGSVIYGGYLKWVLEGVKKYRLDAVYFLARDGHVLKRMADRLEAYAGIPIYYLHAARRTLNLACAADGLSERYIDFLCSGTFQPILNYFTRIGLPRDHAEALARRGFRNPAALLRNADLPRLREVFAENETELLAHLGALRKRTLEYLNGLEVARHRRIGLVDLGWHGTMQRSLETLLDYGGRRPEVHGFYYGLFDAAAPSRTRGLIMHTLACSEFHSIEEQRKVQSMVNLLELLHSAPHGGVVDYARGESGMSPVFADSPVERMQYDEKLSRFQAGAIEAGRASFASLHPLHCRAAAEDLIVTPSAEEAELLGDLRFYDGFEHVGTYKPLVTLPSPWASVSAIHHAYRASYWRAGFLKRLISSSDPRLRAKGEQLAASLTI